MKVIFLDFDGVITTLESRWNIDSEKCKLVKRICDETGAKIVISSSWRKSNLEYTMKQFSKESFLLYDYVVDVTKRLSISGSASITIPRGVEILEYIESHDSITNYVILDDDTDMLLWQRNHFVHTSTYEGINEKNVEQAIKILNMNVEFTTTETIVDKQILKAFGETLCYDEGVFDKESFFESIESSLDMCGLTMTDASKKEITEQLKVLLTKLIEEL